MHNAPLHLPITLLANCQEILYSSFCIQFSIFQYILNMLTDVLFCRIINLCQLILCEPHILIGKADGHACYLIIVLIEYNLVFFVHANSAYIFSSRSSYNPVSESIFVSSLQSYRKVMEDANLTSNNLTNLTQGSSSLVARSLHFLHHFHIRR